MAVDVGDRQKYVILESNVGKLEDANVVMYGFVAFQPCKGQVKTASKNMLELA